MKPSSVSSESSTVDRNADRAGVAAEDRDGVGRAVGAEFPQRRAIAFCATVGREGRGTHLAAHAGALLSTVDVAGDEVEDVFLIWEADANCCKRLREGAFGSCSA
jgi:hypothetical protein